MKRYGLSVCTVLVLAIAASTLSNLAAQVAVPVPARGTAPLAPVPPLPPSAGVPAAVYGQSGMPAARWSGVGANYTTAPVPAGPPADPRVAELTNNYNELEQHVMQLAQQYRRLAQDDENREKLQQQITELTTQQFQLRHEVRQMEVERLQKQLANLQEQLQRREEQKQAIVDRRVKQLTDQDDELRWEPLSMPGAYGGVAYPSAVTGSLAGMPGSWVPPAPSSPTYSPFGPPIVPAPKNVPPAPPETREPNVPALPTVPEAQARLEIADRDFARIKALHEAGAVPSGEFEHAQDAVRLAQIALEQAQRGQELRVNLLKLDARKAEAELESARAELAAATHLSEAKKDDAALRLAAQRAVAAVQAREMELQRAQTMLESVMHGLGLPTPDERYAPKR